MTPNFRGKARPKASTHTIDSERMESETTVNSSTLLASKYIAIKERGHTGAAEKAHIMHITEQSKSPKRISR